MVRFISALIVIAAFVLVIVGGVLAYYYEGDFLSSLRPGFFVSALSVLFVSSLIYSPFSYGVSYYFLRSKTGEARFSDIFYLFRRPRALFGAIICDTLRRIAIIAFRLMILLLAAVLELLLLKFFTRGEAMFVVLHIIAWSGVLILLFLAKIRFILCKYVLICYPEKSPLCALRRGVHAIRGKTAVVIRFYIKYLALFILPRVRNRDSFCTFAVSLIKY